MKKLHNFLIKSFLSPFVATFFIAIFILLMQFLWKWVDELIGKGLEIDIILKLIFYAAARFVPLALPIAMLIASIMTFGNMGEKNELAALKASGISLRKTLTPLLLFAIIISYSSFLYSNYILPVANLKNGTLLYDIQKKKPAINIREGEFYNEIDGYSIKIGKKDSKTNTLYDILIYDHTSQQSNDKVIIAESGEMRFTNNGETLELILYNGSSYVEIFNKDRAQKLAHQRINFQENIIRFDLEKFGLKRSDESIYKNHYSMMSVQQLNKSIDSLDVKFTERKNHFSENYTNKFNLNIKNNNDSTKIVKSNRSETEIYDFAINKVRSTKALLKSNSDDLKYRQSIINRHKIEWHRKYSLAFACIILFIIGASIGSIIRKGGFGIPVLISIILFVLYHVLNMIGEKAVKESTLLPYEGMWMANLVFLSISLRLLYIANKNDLSGFTISHYTQKIYNETIKQIKGLYPSKSNLSKLFIEKIKFIIKVTSHNQYLLELLILIPFVITIGKEEYIRDSIYTNVICIGLRILFSTYYFFFKFNNKRFNIINLIFIMTLILISYHLLLYPVIITIVFLWIWSYWKIFTKAGESTFPLNCSLFFCVCNSILLYNNYLVMENGLYIISVTMLINILINIYILLLLLKIARVPWWWILLIFIPFAGVVWVIWMTNRVIKGFGKSEGFTIGCIFLPFIFYPILGFGSATYDPNRLEQIE